MKDNAAVWLHDLVACVALLLLWLAVWSPRLRGPIDLRWDASVYYILGTSLAEGKGYRLLNEPGEIEAVQYPPLIPLIVAAQQRALGTSDYLEVSPRLRQLYFLLSSAYLFAGYALLRTFVRPPYALIAVSLTAVSFVGFLYPSEALFSEMPFALISMLFLLVQFRSRHRRHLVAAGLLAAAAYLARTAAVALLAAWVGESLLRGRLREAAVRAAIASVPLLLWQAHVSRVMASTEYDRPAYSYQRAAYYYSNVSYAENGRLVDPFQPELGRSRLADLPGRMLRNLAMVPGALGESTWISPTSLDWFRDKARTRWGLPLPSNRFIGGVLVALGCTILVGAVLFAARGEWLLPLYLATTVGLISLTPWPGQFWRYLAPLAPISLLFLVHALRVAGSWLAGDGRSWTRTAGAFVVTAPLASMLLVGFAVASGFLRHVQPVSYYDAHGNESTYPMLTYDPEWQALNPAMEWLRRHADRGTVIASSVPHMTYLRTGHRSVLPPMEPDPVMARRLLDEVPVSYVLLDQFEKPGLSRRYAGPAVESQPEEWTLVFTTTDRGARIYERNRR